MKDDLNSAVVKETKPNVVHWNVIRNSPGESYSYVYNDEDQQGVTPTFVDKIINEEFNQWELECEGGYKLIRIWGDEGDETLVYMDVDGWRYVDSFDGLEVDYQR